MREVYAARGLLGVLQDQPPADGKDNILLFLFDHVFLYILQQQQWAQAFEFTHNNTNGTAPTLVHEKMF